MFMSWFVLYLGYQLFTRPMMFLVFGFDPLKKVCTHTDTTNSLGILSAVQTSCLRTS
uniref:Uncharacterized protein n=1 Tax=Manihot esculenta TaxID=3983 RepID=A0A2C9VGF3_MANES